MTNSLAIKAILVFLFFFFPQRVVSQNGDTLRYKYYLFVAQPVPEMVQAQMQGHSMPQSATINFDELLYLTVYHYDYDGHKRKGELVCNKTIAHELLCIFRALFSRAYPINSIRLVDDFNADDEASMQANNTSCFNYRTVARSKTLSKHALGLAIDINLLENPYVKGSFVQPSTATVFVDRNKEFPHKIDETDFCKEVFESFGFQWGGYWRSVKDYQHFEKRK